MFIQIPLSLEEPKVRVTAVVDNVTYVFNFTWNFNYNYAIMDIYTEQLEPILEGLVLVNNAYYKGNNNTLPQMQFLHEYGGTYTPTLSNIKEEYTLYVEGTDTTAT